MVKRLKARKSDVPGTIRYGAPKRDRTLSLGDLRTIDAIVAHITKHVGKPSYVFHEIYSELVHVDIHVVPPTKKRPSWLLITSGMSDRPMHTPQEAKHLRFAELAIALPKWWKLDERALKSERWYWPIRWMKVLARFPHEFETWFCYLHTVPMSEEFPAPGTKFAGVLFWADSEFPEKFWKLPVAKTKKIIHFLSPLPIYEEEMALRLKENSETLIDRMSALGQYDSYDPKRVNSCATTVMKRRTSRPKRGSTRKYP
jgi:hypothetical protein